MNRILISIFE